MPEMNMAQPTVRGEGVTRKENRPRGHSGIGPVGQQRAEAVAKDSRKPLEAGEASSSKIGSWNVRWQVVV